jgi:DHA1 family multidrug resistance protein-like MFS transporter
VAQPSNQHSNSRNLNTVTIKTFLRGMASSMMRAIMQPFVLSLGAPMSTLGLLESLGGLRGILTASLQYYSGWLSDHLGRKPFMILGNVAGLLGISLFIIAALTGNWLWLMPGIVFIGATLMADPADQSMVAESSQAHRRGAAYSMFTIAWIAPGIFAPALGGWLAERWGFVPVFALQAALYVLSLLLVLRFLRETIISSGERITWDGIKAATVRLAVPPRRLRGYYWTMAADSFTWGLGFTLLFGMLTQTYGFTTFQLGIMSSLMALTWTLCQWPVGKLIDRFGSKPVMLLSQVGSLPIVLGFMSTSSFLPYAGLYAGMGIMAATWVPAQRVMLANSTSERGLGEALGRLAAFQGLIGFPAPFIGGLLYDHLGFQAPLMAGFVGIIVTTVMLFVWVEEPSRQVELDQRLCEDNRTPGQ